MWPDSSRKKEDLVNKTKKLKNKLQMISLKYNHRGIL